MPIFIVFTICFILMCGSMGAFISALLGFSSVWGAIIGAGLATVLISMFVEID